MKVLICASGNRDTLSPFVKEQAESLKKLDIEIDYFLIEGKGVCGYLKNIPAFRNMVDKGNYSLVHAHYGLSGLFATFQRKIPGGHVLDSVTSGSLFYLYVAKVKS